MSPLLFCFLRVVLKFTRVVQDFKTEGRLFHKKAPCEAKRLLPQSVTDLGTEKFPASDPLVSRTVPSAYCDDSVAKPEDR